MGDRYKINIGEEEIELHDIRKYQEGIKRIRQAKKWIDDLALMETSTVLRKDVLAIIEEAVRGTLEVCKEIYEPLIDKEKVKKVRGHGPNDYLTDFEALDEIPNLFIK